MMALDLIQTLALAALVLFVGYGVRRRVGVLDRYNIPAPVVGGFPFALLILAGRLSGRLAIEFDTTLQTPLMIAFFTTIGLGASVGLVKIGGPEVVLFWILATVVAVLQSPQSALGSQLHLLIFDHRALRRWGLTCARTVPIVLGSNGLPVAHEPVVLRAALVWTRSWPTRVVWSRRPLRFTSVPGAAGWPWSNRSESGTFEWWQGAVPS